MDLVTQSAALQARFPLPPHLQPHFTLVAKQEFAKRFVEARDEAEGRYYDQVDQHTTPSQRTRQFIGALFNPMIGRPVKDAEEFYETFGRLMRWAWLSIGAGVYDEDIMTISDPAIRLHVAQVNTVDVAWRAAMSCVPEDGLIVEVGTGRGNSMARLALLFPRARIVTITISPEQVKIAREIAANLGLTNVEVRLGDILDRQTSADLIGQADAVGALEVTGHFPYAQKAEGIGILASMLKPGAPITITDTAMGKPLKPADIRYYENQSWYLGSRESYLSGYEQAGVETIGYLDFSQDMLQTLPDTSAALRRYRRQLRQEFGFLMSLIWPEIPGTVYLSAIKQTVYINAVGIKQSAQ